MLKGLLKKLAGIEELLEYKQLVEQARDGMFIFDNSGFKLINQAICSITGYTKRELLNMSFYSMIPDKRELEGILRARSYSKEGEAPIYSARIQRSDGILLPISLVLIRKKEKIYGSLRDEYILNSLNEAISIVNKEGYLTYANPAYWDMHELFPGEILGKKPAEELYDEQQKEKLKEQLVSRKNGYTSSTYELTRETRSGKILELEISGSPIYITDKNGNKIPNGSCSVIRERSKIKKLEEEIHRMHRIEIVGNLSNAIAHHFNNVLTGIVGNISLVDKEFVKDIKEPELKEKIKKHTNFALEACSDLKDRIINLLDFSKGKDYKEDSLENISSVIDSCLKLCYQPDNINIIKKIDYNLPIISLDIKIKEGIFETMTNAIKAMPDGGELKITAEDYILDTNESKKHPEKNRGRYMKITIQDTGKGIEQEHLKKIFDPYFTTRDKGIGLGLSIMYNAVKKQSGYMDVQSELGKGTMFEIYLPMRKK